MDALAKLEALEKAMNDDNSQEEVVELISKIQENKSTLVEADLRHKSVPSNLLTEVLDNLRFNTNVTTLALSGNTLEMSVLCRLACLLLENRVIDVLELDFCDLTDEHVRVLIAALEVRKPMLGQLKLLGNNVSAKIETEALANTREVSSKKSPTISPSSLRNNSGARTLIEALVTQNTVMREQLADYRQRGEKKNVEEKKKNMEQVKKHHKVKINLTNLQINELTATGTVSGTNLYTCLVDGWQCCMKEMSLEGGSEAEIKAFDSEIELLEKLPYHPNIVRYLFHERTDDKVRLFMTKYAVSLREVITNRRLQVSQEQATYFHPIEIAKWVAQIANGVEFLHKNHVIHRNLKPDNVLCTLNSRGFMSTLAITEFDSAKSISKKKQAKTTIGTPSYMSPEVISSDNSSPYTHKVDVWGIGMLLYELITLMVPYEDENFVQLNAIITSGQRPSTHHIAVMYNPLLDIFRDCTQLDPNKRPEVKRVREQLLQVAAEFCSFEVSQAEIQ